MDTQDERADQLAALVEAALPDPEPTGPELPPDDADFIVTKEHRRFAEFAAAVRRDRYIGLCYGPPGVGKTASARRYACWHELEPLLRGPGRYFTEGRDRADWHTLLYTPTVSATPRMIDKELTQLGWNLAIIRTPDPFDRRTYASTHALPPFVELLEKRLARYPQRYSRIGFIHEYRTLSADELLFVLQHHWSKLCLTLSADDFTDTEALAAVARITGGNFRLVQRLFAQIQRIMEVNNLSTITKEVVETARESLVIGSL